LERLLIALCYAAGLAVHYRYYERTAIPSLSFDEPADEPAVPNFRASRARFSKAMQPNI
jgi:hypothetical protein